MAKSRTRRNRRQRRAAAALVATTAAAGLAFGTTIQAAPAHALALPDIAATCGPGEFGGDPDSGVTADCTGASASILATAGDWIIQQLGLDIPIGLSNFNSATAVGLDLWASDFISLLPEGLDQQLIDIPAHASMTGMGFNSAIAMFGNASANAQDPLSGAIAVGLLGNSTASALFGLGVSMGVGGLGALDLGDLGLDDIADLVEMFADFDPDSLKAETNANALPLGVPMAIVLLTNDKASATALGGVASAKSSIFPGQTDAVCTAVYAQAQVTDNAGNNKSSCTSVLFIFQQSQQGDGPVVYAIKNPFSIDLVSPLPVPNLASLVGALPEGVIDDDMMAMLSLLSGNFVPKFNQDLIRITMGPNGPEFGSDLFGNTASSTSARTEAAVADDDEPAIASLSVGDEEAEPAGAPDVEALGDEGPEAEAPEAAAPEAEAPEVETPEIETPEVEAPEIDTPEADTTEADEPEVDADEPEAAADL